MRKQYHLRPSENGFLAWDVDKLVQATITLNLETINIQDIKEPDENYWYHGPDDVPTCRSIAEYLKLTLDADLSFPIILSAEGRVMDGMHRVIKALVAGAKEIKAYRFKRTPKPDFSDVSLSDLVYERLL